MEYKGKMVFDVEHQPTYGSIRVEIDFDKKIRWGDSEIDQMQHISEMQNFWYGASEKLSEAEGDVVKAFLIQLCRKAISLGFEHNENLFGVIDRFKTEEGYCLMDGSQGIKITSLDQMEINNDEDYQINIRE